MRDTLGGSNLFVIIVCDSVFELAISGLVIVAADVVVGGEDDECGVSIVGVGSSSAAGILATSLS